MIDDLRPYSEMKPSGLPWLGDVPAHWEVKRSKYIFREADKRSTTGEETHLSMSQRHGLVPAGQITRSLVSESYVGGKLVERNDLVLNRLKAHLGVFAYAKQPGLISPDYTVLRPQDGAEVRYFEAVLKSPACRGELFTRAKGIVEGFWRLYTDDFYNIRVPVPPIDEQRLIVRFLDWHGGQVARLVRAKKALIGLLNEQKQAIIHRAVTRGLDPNAKLKPSGIPSVGEVPEGWEVRRLKTVCRFAYGDSLASETRALGEIQVFGSNGCVGKHSCANTKAPCVVIGRKGSFGKVNWSNEPVFAIDTTFFVDSRSTDANLRWLFHLLSWLRLDDVSRDTAVPGLSRGDAYQRVIALPAETAVQAEIANFIDNESQELNRVIESVQREIVLIHEFRTRMIADVVTGKLDVRALAATLPEIAGQELTFDLAEDGELDDLPEDSDIEEAAA